MAKIYDSITELVGETPLVHLHRYEEKENVQANILAKFEYFNPSGSVKDRAALNIIEEAEKRGDIKPGMTLIDYTSGNTGIGEATFANAKGYKFVAVIQPQVSVERSQILKALGAELLQVTDVPGFAEMLKTGLSLEGLYKVMHDFAESNGWYYLNQCADPANSEAHIKGTGPEIWEATGGKVDYVVQLVGTGGTLSGLAKFFREKNPDVKICANFVSLEGLCEMKEFMRSLESEGIERNIEIRQVAVSRAQRAGAFHLMKALNPVWLVSF